ncbi:hypothetical protein [Nocardia sp. NPDC052566]|uniref:hypothetical protein n=1 Tax=Nocardia sp. NPDC052566 TaxID=3364330 RepID=UPI0037CB0477
MSSTRQHLARPRFEFLGTDGAYGRTETGKLTGGRAAAGYRHRSLSSAQTREANSGLAATMQCRTRWTIRRTIRQRPVDSVESTGRGGAMPT